MVNPKPFTWLHISDLHAGMSEQRWLWPDVKQRFFEDLRKLIRKTGAIDAVFFTGDITLFGDPAQFQIATRILQETWSVLEALQALPVLLAIPGNHDLVRPPPNLPAALLLQKWWEIDTVRSDTLNDPASDYRSLIASAFANYADWYNSLSGVGIQTATVKQGLFPGDFSVELDDNLVGVVGLNSAWLALDRGDHEGRLDIDPRQLYAAVDENVAVWLAKHSYNLLLTHHPAPWLHPKSFDYWNANINPPERFDAHLFGHMHRLDATTVAHGGGPPRQSLQGASLFGLERIDGGLERIHGYSVGQIRFGDGEKIIRVWPRRLQSMLGSYNKIIPAPEFVLSDEAFELHTGSVGTPKSSGYLVPVGGDISSLPLAPDSSASNIDNVRLFLPPSPSSVNVRRVEQKICIEALSSTRAVWLIADWGAGTEGFVWALQRQMGDGQAKTFRIDLQDYTDRENFLSGIKRRLNLGFEQFCAKVADVGIAYLWLDEFPITAVPVASQPMLVADLEDMVATALQYCPDLKIMITCRGMPQVTGYAAVPLKPLDEADVLNYVLDSDQGGPEYTTASAISTIYRHSDGVPALIDSTLRDLEFTTIDQLAAHNRDLARVDDAPQNYPAGLLRTVDELAATSEPVKKRALQLLKALSLFPQGEGLERLKRFYGVHPLMTAHARELLGSSLISTSAKSMLDSQEKRLVVPKTVRDFVLSRLKQSEWRDLSRKAANLYFGERWTEGIVKESAANRFSDPHADGAELVNAGTIVTKIINDEVSSGEKRQIESAVDLFRAFVTSLANGNHYRSIITICRDVLPIMPKDFDGRVVQARLSYARSLRMVDENQESKEVALTLLDVPTNDVRQGAYVSLALTEVALNNSEAAVEAAENAFKVDSKSKLGLQAKSIILQEAKGVDNRDEQLRELEKKARKRGAFVVANNLAIDRANDETDPKTIDAALEEVLQSAIKDKDFYNGARALVKKARIITDRGEQLSDGDKQVLLRIYNFVFSERMQGLFEQSHDVLWAVFERENDTRSLFRLFRQSSLIWRLRGKDNRERAALTRLAKVAGSMITTSNRRPDREALYYLVRIGGTMEGREVPRN